MKPLWIGVVAILCVQLVQGCTKEDRTDCGIAVRFKYDKNVDGDNKFSSSVYSLELHIFDATGKYIETWKASAPAGTFLPADFEFKLPHLKPGTYTFVAWGNVNGSLFTETELKRDGLSAFGSSTLTFNADGGAAPRTENMSLFHGSIQSLVVEKDKEGIQVYTVDLLKFTNTIVVTIKGLPVGSSKDNPYDFYIISKNGNYRFDGQFASPNPAVTYTPFSSIVQSDGTIVLTFTTLRELNNNATESELIITWTNPDNPLDVVEEYRMPLVDVLVKIAGDERNRKNKGNLDIDDLFNIDLTFDYTSSTVTVSINGWVYGEFPSIIY